MSDKKPKYQSKTIKFGSSTLTLFSLDGQTWSSRKTELAAIKERQEAQRVTLGDIKEEEGATSEEAAKEADDKPVEISAEMDTEESETTPEKTEVVEEDDTEEYADELDDDLPMEEPKRAEVEKPVAKLKSKPPKVTKKPVKPALKLKKKPSKPVAKKGKPAAKGKRKAA